MPKGNLPRVATLKRWAHLNFQIWLENKTNKSKHSPQANDSEVAWFPLRSRWREDGVDKFFEYKESQGGNQGLSWIDPQSTLIFRLLNVLDARIDVSVPPVTGTEERKLFGCNKEFVVLHEAHLREIFKTKRY